MTPISPGPKSGFKICKDPESLQDDNDLHSAWTGTLRKRQSSRSPHSTSVDWEGTIPLRRCEWLQIHGGGCLPAREFISSTPEYFNCGSLISSLLSLPHSRHWLLTFLNDGRVGVRLLLRPRKPGPLISSSSHSRFTLPSGPWQLAHLTL
jgi:hypothetical protein